MEFRWNEWNIEHIAKHGVSAKEAELTIRRAKRPFPRKVEDDKWLVWGQMMKRKKPWQMTVRELAATTKQFDEPFVIDQSRPLDATERKQWARLEKARGRPKIGQGYQRVSVSIEKGLLERATALAKKCRVSRSKLVAIALEQALAKQT